MFTARRYDIETGLYYYRARYYNPYIGRFLQKDPAGQGMNMYAYCMNNSLNFTDPMGLVAIAFYDSLESDNVFTEAADDFKYRFDMNEAYALNMNLTLL